MRTIAAILLILSLGSCSATKDLTEEKVLGKYRWKDIYGVGASINLKSNGVFEYSWAIGLMSGTTRGTWTLEGRIINLNSESQPDSNPDKDSEIINTEHNSTNVLTLKIIDIDDNPVVFANCYLERSNKAIEHTTSDLDGYAQFNKVDSDSLAIHSFGCKPIKIKYDSTVSNYEIRMQETKSYYEFLTNKKLTFKRQRLYDSEMQKNKYIIKKYYERLKIK